ALFSQLNRKGFFRVKKVFYFFREIEKVVLATKKELWPQTYPISRICPLATALPIFDGYCFSLFQL
ncbi:MAG: hypothetical protein RR911_08020, partial [Oscillospiraceae bacterium]